jgi:hypothetical protein
VNLPDFLGTTVADEPAAAAAAPEQVPVGKVVAAPESDAELPAL